MPVQPEYCIIVVNLDLTFWSDKLFYDFLQKINDFELI